MKHAEQPIQCNPMIAIPLKTFCADEARRGGVKPRAIHSRIARGTYPGLSLFRINRRVIFVDPASIPLGGFKLTNEGRSHRLQ